MALKTSGALAATDKTSRPHFQTSAVSASDLAATQSTLRPDQLGSTAGSTKSVNFAPIGSAVGEDGEGLKSLVARLESLQLQQRSPQQPNPELDAAIIQALSVRPEFRQRMAVMTKSPWLRRKILLTLPPGGRAVGSDQLGSTHPWRKRNPPNVSDHNWPKMANSERGPYLPGGPDEQSRHLRAPADKMQFDPLLHSHPCYSVPRAQRFSGIGKNGEIDREAASRRAEATPGPGEYFRSMPRGAAFLADGGETVVLGANHIAPWKGCLGHNINPVDIDATSISKAPIWTFPKTRRSASDVAVGLPGQDGRGVKTDRACLSPGYVYECTSTFRPAVGKSACRMRKSHSTSYLSRRRCYPVEPEPDTNGEQNQNERPGGV